MMKDAYLLAYKIRKVEQTLLDLFSKGVVGGTIHTCVGQEFSGIAVAKNLKSNDTVVSNHRCHGHYLAVYEDYEGLIAEILGKSHGVNRGFGGSQHLHREGFYSSGIQGGMLPSAAGIALSNKLSGNNNIVVSFIGDGTLGQGIVYETFNFISKHSLPHLVVVENNFYSQSTSQHETLAGTIRARAEAFGIDFFQGSTNAPEALFEKMEMAINFVRNESRPAIFEIQTYRLNPHSKGDDLRNPSEIQKAKDDDSLNIFLNNYSEEIQNELREFDNYVDQIVDKALKTEDSLKLSMPEFKDSIVNEKKVSINSAQTTQLKEINRAFHQIFADDSNALFLGEDVLDPYGGAFKASKGLSTNFPGRVFNMPISEAAIVGVSLGAATTGRTTIAEIMFGDFMALAFDQIINHAAKMKNMFGRNVDTPLILRTPMGGGRGYGATHSQCLEKHFLGVPDLDVFQFHPRVDAYSFYQHLCDDRKLPAIVFEHKLLYSQDPFKKAPDLYEVTQSDEKYPYTRISTDEGKDITIVAFGTAGLLLESLIDKFSDEEVYLDVFYPLNLNSTSFISGVVSSLKETRKILFIEEGTPVHNLSDFVHAEISKRVSSEFTFYSNSLCSKSMPLPASIYLERQVLPSTPEIENAVWELFDE